MRWDLLDVVALADTTLDMSDTHSHSVSPSGWREGGRREEEKGKTECGVD